MSKHNYLRRVSLICVALSFCVSAIGTSIAMAEKTKLAIWWFGEQENPGQETYMYETMAMYEKKHPNVQIELTLQSVDGLMLAWRAAAAAGEGPDLQYLWGAVGTLEDVWLGNVAPLSDYWSEEELSHLKSREITRFQGKDWLCSWYSNPQVIGYNKEVFFKSGLDPRKSLRTWDEFLRACEKIKTSGFIPFAMGNKEGIMGEFFITFLVKQNLDGMRDLLAPFIGKAKFTDPKYAEAWSRLLELKNKGYVNEDVNSLPIYQSQQYIPRGKAAMCWTTGGTIGWTKAVGPEKIGTMPQSSFGKGKQAYVVGTPTHGFVIPIFAKHKEESANVLRFMHTPERLNAMYKACGALIADDRFDIGIVTNPVFKHNVELANKYPGLPYNMITPYEVVREGYNSAFPMLMAGKMAPKEAAEIVQRSVEKWQYGHPDFVKYYTQWYEGYKS